MKEVTQLLLLVALAGVAMTFLGSAAIWFMDEARRVRRALKHVAEAVPDVLLVARGRGRGVGISFATNRCVVAWDAGAWCLVYQIDELMGAELIIDGQVVGRAFRGETRRALEQLVTQASRVTLRLIFDDPHHPDFDLDMWVAGDERRRVGGSPADAVHEANQWLARADAILRRPQAPRAAPPPVVAQFEREAPQQLPWDEADEVLDEDAR